MADPDSVFPEVDKPWALVCQTPEGVLDAVSLYDENTDSTYYTHVARRLIEDAARVDEGIRRVYYDEDTIIQ